MLTRPPIIRRDGVANKQLKLAVEDLAAHAVTLHRGGAAGDATGAGAACVTALLTWQSTLQSAASPAAHPSNGRDRGHSCDGYYRGHGVHGGHRGHVGTSGHGTAGTARTAATAATAGAARRDAPAPLLLSILHSNIEVTHTRVITFNIRKPARACTHSLKLMAYYCMQRRASFVHALAVPGVIR